MMTYGLRSTIDFLCDEGKEIDGELKNDILKPYMVEIFQLILITIKVCFI